MGPISVTSGYCEEGRCCINYIQINGKCVACPVGTFGVNCTSPCPVGYYGLFCESKCECNADELCKSNVGCTSPEQDSSSALAGSLIVLTIMIVLVLVVYVGKRYNIWNTENLACLRLCKGDSAHNDESNQASSHINSALSSTNNPGYPYYSYSVENVYEGIEKETPDEYDEIELRCRNVFCDSVDMDASVQKSGYFTLERMIARKKIDEEGGSNTCISKDEYETPLKTYDLASDTKGMF